LLQKLRKRTPVVFDELMERGGADVDALKALEKKLEKALLPELRALLSRFDGDLPIFEYTTLSAADIPGWAKAPKKPGVPFAADGGGNLLCLDSEGRVQQWELRGRGVFEVAATLEALLGDAIRGGDLS
jgi:hypothetical protein